MPVIFQLILAIVFIALVCFLTYKAVLPVCLKIIDLSIEFPVFRKSLCLFLALAFGIVGILQLIDFSHEAKESIPFLLSFLSSAIFFYLCCAPSKI